jgi:hypothetical protein
MPIHERVSEDIMLSAVEPQIVSGSTTTAGAIIDTAGYSKGVYFGLQVNAWTDGTYTLKLEHGDNASLTDAAVVPTANLVYGTLPAISAAIAEGGAYVREGVFGTKRYVRASVVSTSVSTGATVAVVAILTANLAPTDQD